MLKVRAYRMDCFKRDDNGNLRYKCTVEGVTKDPDIAASAFKQNQEVLDSDAVQLSYYDIVN